MMTRGTFTLGAVAVNRLLVAREISAFRNAVLVPCDVKMFGKSSTRISFRLLGGLGITEVDEVDFGTAKPFRVALFGLTSPVAGVLVGASTFGTATRLSDVRTPNCRAVVRVDFARNDGNWLANDSRCRFRRYQRFASGQDLSPYDVTYRYCLRLSCTPRYRSPSPGSGRAESPSYRFLQALTVSLYAD